MCLAVLYDKIIECSNTIIFEIVNLFAASHHEIIIILDKL